MEREERFVLFILVLFMLPELSTLIEENENRSLSEVSRGRYRD
jgi:hypothetical protein